MLDESLPPGHTGDVGRGHSTDEDEELLHMRRATSLLRLLRSSQDPSLDSGDLKREFLQLTALLRKIDQLANEESLEAEAAPMKHDEPAEHAPARKHDFESNGSTAVFVVDRVGRWPKDGFPTDAVYRQADVAALLGKSKQAVSADPRLLKLVLRSGEVGYPVFQFDGRQQLPGVRDVIGVLAPVVATPWTIASWLTSPSADLDGETPEAALRAGRVDAVTAAADRFARAAA
jgi:hypothetical protein